MGAEPTDFYLRPWGPPVPRYRCPVCDGREEFRDEPHCEEHATFGLRAAWWAKFFGRMSDEGRPRGPGSGPVVPRSIPARWQTVLPDTRQVYVADGVGNAVDLVARWLRGRDGEKLLAEILARPDRGEIFLSAAAVANLAGEGAKDAVLSYLRARLAPSSPSG
jgi:hypothetical protein